MSHLKQLVTPAQALCRVFVRQLSPDAAASASLRPACISPHRHYHYGPSTFDRAPNGRSPIESTRPSRRNPKLNIENFGPKREDAGKNDVPRDENIRASRVYVIQADNKRGEPIRLEDALDARSRDERGRLTQYLRQVREPDDQIPYPLCRYYDKQYERDKDLAKKKAAKASKTEQKQLEINWTVSDNDLSHRMARLKEFLEKGWKVDVVIGSTRKRGWSAKRTDNLGLAGNLVAKVREAALQVAGSREKAEMKGKLGEEASLSFEGPKKKESAAG